MKVDRIIRRSAALLALCMALSGCAPVAFEVQPESTGLVLPEPEVSAPAAPMGDRGEQIHWPVLYQRRRSSPPADLAGSLCAVG